MTKPKRINRICAWCKIILGTKEVSAGNSGMDTHGICPKCYKKVMGELKDVKSNVGTRL